MQRITTYSRFGPFLLRGYANGPSRDDRFGFMCMRDKVLHEYAERLASLGHTGAVPKPSNTVIVIGDDINVHNKTGIKGLSMSWGRLFQLLNDFHYVRGFIQVDEYLTSQVCNKCYHEDGSRIKVEKVPAEERKDPRQEAWRLRKCPRCLTFWHRDYNAALNIRSIWLYQRENGGERPAAFRRNEDESEDESEEETELESEEE
jgi:hypothetical protein